MSDFTVENGAKMVYNHYRKKGHGSMALGESVKGKEEDPDMISMEELRQRIINACEEVSDNADILTDIDSQFGDADHGATMISISKAMTAAARDADGTIRHMMQEVSVSVEGLSGGNIVPLWHAWLEGLYEGSPDVIEASVEDIRSMFAHGLTSIQSMSDAKVGDKTMMDALIPASDAIAASNGDVDEILDMASLAALNGAEFSKLVPAKFGSARAFGEKTIGTPDVGAMSISFFFMGLSRK